MVPKRTSHKLFSLIVRLFCTGIVVVVCCLVPTVSSRSARLEQDLNQRFLDYQPIKLDTRAVLQQVRDTGRLSLATSDLSFDVELAPHDLRAQGYRAEVFGADGVGRTIDIGAVKTYKGRARGTQNGAQLPQLGEARFTIDETQIEGLIITPTEHYFVEPAQNFSDAANALDYVLYRESDVITSSTGDCGVTLSEEVSQKAESIGASADDSTLIGAAAGLQELRIATEADNEYVISKGGAAPADQKILSIINKVEGLYEVELGLTIRVIYQSAWGTANDPFSSTNASALLSELTNFWNSNRGSVARDVVHMWTGKQLENSTIGTAYLDALCRFTGSGRAAYGLSKEISNETQQVAVTAHEIGHNLGATHPNQQVPPVRECSDTTMASSVNSGTHLSFCQFSRDEITRYLGTNAGCLGGGTTGLRFAVSTPFPLGQDPNAITAADFNGDGKQDLATANIGGNVSVLLGTDDGALKEVSGSPFPVGSTPRSITATDLNGDGRVDIAIANAGSNDVSVLLGESNGSFANSTGSPFTAGRSPSSITAADFDRDGKLDLAVTNAGDANVSVLRGTGDGAFLSPTNYATGASPGSITTADFNLDSNPDLAVTSGGNVSVLLGTGPSGFQPVVHYLFGVFRSIVAGDFNNDGKIDLITTNDDFSNVMMLRGIGDGTFQSSVVIAYALFSQLNSSTTADFNGDGNLDLAISIIGEGFSIRTGHLSVRLGDGNGNFSPDNIVLANGVPTALTQADLNGDGKVDLATAIPGNVSALLGDGDGKFQAVASYKGGQAPNAMTAADFNGDGKLDLAAIDQNVDFEDFLVVVSGGGDGTFKQTSSSFRGVFKLGQAITAGDFNGDGAVDIATACAFCGFERILVFLGNNSGSFPNTPTLQLEATLPRAITNADLNNDGRSDLIVADSGNISVGVFLANSTGSFQPPVNYATASSPASVAIGDFNEDGKLDLVSTGTLMLGNGDGTFNLFNHSEITAGVSGDFNSDGHLDLVTSNTYLRGNGDGTFTVKSGNGVGGVGLTGDFNRDGKLDLAIHSGNQINVRLGNGDGSFGLAIIYIVGLPLRGLAVGDFNRDGKVDLAATLILVLPSNRFGQFGVLLNNSGQSLGAPINDSFISARVITGPNGTLPSTTLLATKETGEPNHASVSNGTGGASIWYRWRAPSTGKFHFQTFTSSFPSVIAVYTGATLSSLTSVVKSTNTFPEYVEFDATAGTTYQIAIDGVNGDTGRTVLSWNTGSLSNDNFAFAREIRGSSGSVNGNNTSFTLEPSEPTLPGAAGAFSAWYRWTAPNTGKVSFLATPLAPTPCGDTTRLLGAYTGNFIDILSPVAVNFDGYRDFDDPGACDNRSLRFNAVAGTTYRIQLRSGTGKPFTLSWNYADPPPNDNFANALILAGASGSLVGSNRDATKEPGELNHAGGPGGASIWYRWTAPTTGPVTFDTIGFRNQTANSFRYLNALIAVYTGSSLNGLTTVVTNATDNKVTYNATAGTTYQIAVDSAPYSGGGYLPGIVPLHWGAKQVANDDFVNAQPLTASGSFVALLSSNAGATKETGEPNHQGNNGGSSVWYRWTALSTGNVSFVLNPCITCSLATSNALVAVYTGPSVNALTLVPSTADNNHTFAALRGATYFIAVDSRTTGGSFELSLVSANISARNDAFANAQVLSGSAGAVAGDNSGASREISEPNHANDIGGASVWYQWKAPASGLYTFDTFGSNFDTLLGVYTGNVVSALTVVASSDNAGSSAQSRFTFDAKLNTTYFIAVDGKSNGVEAGTGLARSQAGFILLNWNNLPPPVNDNFASAQVVTDTTGNVSGRNTVASKEGGEPNHAGSPGGVSVWYQWTAPSSGNFTFNTFGSDFNTLLGVYTGSALTALSAVSSNDDVGGLRQSRVTFNATADTTYYISIDGSAGVPGSVTAFSGNVVLSWFPETGVSNDNFLLAQSLSGASGSLAATNAGATKQTDEPNHAGDRGGRSVWYSWTAPFTGPVLFTTAGSDFDTLLAIYSGSSLNQLTPLASNDDSPYTDNLGHILTSSLTFNATSGATYRIAVDGSGGRFGNFALRWGPDAKISGQVSFIGGVCGSDKKVTMLLSGEDTRAITFSGSGTYTFQHLRVGGNYSVRGVSEISASCLPLFLERAQNAFPLPGDLLDTNFFDDGLRGGGSTSNITGHVQNATSVGLHNVAVALSGTASRTVYTDNAGLYLLPNLPAGTYQVTPSKAGVVFTPATREFTFTTGQTITDADFVTQDSFNLSGQSRDLNGSALSGVNITLSNGSQPVSTQQTDANGYYSFDAGAGDAYTLTATKAGLSFAPAAQSIPPLNENKKNLDFTVTQLFTLTISSTNPATGVPITVTPNDNNGQSNGNTQFTRSYGANTVVDLTAPATASGNNFQKWEKDGADFSSNLATSVTLDSNHTLTAIYVTPTRTLTIASSNPGSGVSITVTPNDNNNQGGGQTQFTRTYNLNSNVTLTAPATANGNVFQKWLKDGADYSTNVATSVLLDTDHTLTAVYLTTTAQTPAGQNVTLQLNNVKVTFTTVTGAGTTTITPINPATAGQLPNGYQLTGDSVAFDISTTATVQPPISVCFNLPAITDATVFAQLRLLHNENGVLVDRTASQDFANKLVCANVNSLSPFVLASSTVPLLQLLLEDSSTIQAAALDAVLLVRDPFPVVNPGNLLNPGTDRNTRVLVFVKNLQLQAGETAAVVTVNLVDSSGRSYDIVAENLWTMPAFEFSQLTFRLPNDLAPGVCTVQARAHGQVSNVGVIRIKL